MMAETDASSGSGSSGSGDTSTATMTSTTVDPTMSTSMTTSPTTTSMPTTTLTTTTDPDTTSTTDDSADDSSGGCPPGTEGCPCDVGSTCEGELLCEGGVCLGEPACEQPEGEPNDDEASAVMLDGVTCNAMGTNTEGAFGGAESDWLVFRASDNIACFGGPQIEVTADIDVAVCAFPICADGDASVTCEGGSDEEESPEGVAGCCDQNGVRFDFDCGIAVAQTADVLVRLTSVDAGCSPYAMEYTY